MVTLNTKAEADVLKKNGFEENEIRHISFDESGQALFGKPFPLILPILSQIESEKQFTSFLITNSDIYAAVRFCSISRFWSLQAPALGLTREETPELALHDFNVESPYRGGLDAFFLTRKVLPKINSLLGTSQAARRMAFGVPGWDYLLSAYIVSPQIGGSILDSQVLLHKSHKKNYDNIDEFEHYIPDLQRLGYVTTKDAVSAAAEFTAFIEKQCSIHKNSARATRILYYKRAKAESAEYANSYFMQFEECWENLNSIAPTLCSSYRKKTMYLLYQRLANDSSAAFDVALSLFCNSPSASFRFDQVLMATVFSLSARQAITTCRIFTKKYPSTNKHAPALLNILKHHDETDPLRRYWIACLFSSELVDHLIFNPRLFQYLVLSSDNDWHYSLLNTIVQSIKVEVKNVA